VKTPAKYSSTSPPSKSCSCGSPPPPPPRPQPGQLRCTQQVVFRGRRRGVRIQCCNNFGCFFRGGVRGEPHEDTLDGGDVDEYFAGVFTYFSNGKGCEVQVRYGEYGNGAAINGIAGKCGDSSFSISCLNGKMEHTMNNGKAMRIKREEGREDIVLFRAYSVFRGDVVYDKVSNSLSLNFDVNEKVDFDSYHGQCKDGRGVQHTVTKETCFFKHYVEYKKCGGIPDPVNLNKANNFCKGVDDEHMEDCTKDCMITGVDFSNAYRRELTHEDDALKDFSN